MVPAAIAKLTGNVPWWLVFGVLYTRREEIRLESLALCGQLSGRAPYYVTLLVRKRANLGGFEVAYYHDAGRIHSRATTSRSYHTYYGVLDTLSCGVLRRNRSAPGPSLSSLPPYPSPCVRPIEGLTIRFKTLSGWGGYRRRMYVRSSVGDGSTYQLTSLITDCHYWV